MGKDVVLVIGANGQVGSALIPRLIDVYGEKSVIASDITPNIWGWACRYIVADAMDPKKIYDLVNRYDITQIYHLAAVLSANGERDPVRAWEINMKTLLNVLDIAKSNRVSKVFIPSSIAVFGPSAPKDKTGQYTYLDPTTVYGISKVAAENWIFYYNKKYRLDVRSIRYPGIIGGKSLPNGGTTDYAVEMFFKGVSYEVFTCYLKPETALPMIYMDDAIRATIELMEADKGALTVANSYNVAGLSFNPAELVEAIKQYIPNLKVYYEPDFRQLIADSWPDSIDDQLANRDWGWKPKFDLRMMTAVMIDEVSQYVQINGRT